MLELFKSKKKNTYATILVIDDEPDFLSIIEARLKWNKFNVLTALNGHDGLAIAEAEMPDLIILDNNMPGMTGLEMLALLRENEDIRHIPVIMITPAFEPEDIERAGSLNVFAHITKPIDYTNLTEKIFQAIDKK